MTARDIPSQQPPALSDQLVVRFFSFFPSLIYLETALQKISDTNYVGTQHMLVCLYIDTRKEGLLVVNTRTTKMFGHLLVCCLGFICVRLGSPYVGMSTNCNTQYVRYICFQNKPKHPVSPIEACQVPQKVAPPSRKQKDLKQSSTCLFFFSL